MIKKTQYNDKTIKKRKNNYNNFLKEKHTGMVSDRFLGHKVCSLTIFLLTLCP